MLIYQVMEIQSRELDARLLTAIVATNRGHASVIGPARMLFRIARRNPSPAVFHDKSITPTEGRLTRHRDLARRGFIVTAQDEEHGILRPNLDSFVSARFSARAFENVSGVFCWGKRDFLFLSQRFPKFREKLFLTGSPRVDLWRPPLRPTHSPRPNEPTVLFVSNFSVNAILRHWEIIDTKRRIGIYARSSEDSVENTLLDFSRQFASMSSIVSMLQTLAAERPELTIVVRPHPTEDHMAWKLILGNHPNIRVDSSGTTTEALADKLALIHDGCTTGIEACISGIPVISISPTGVSINKSRSNLLGDKVKNSSELLDCVDRLILTPGMRNGAVPGWLHDSVFLRSQSSAEDQVSIWEQLMGRVRPAPHKVGYSLKTRLDGLKLRLLRRSELTSDSWKNPGLTKNDLSQRIGIISERLGLVSPRIKIVSPWVFELRPGN